MDHRNNRKDPSPLGTIISVVVLLLMLGGDLGLGMFVGILLLIAMVAGAIVLPFWLIRRRKHISSHQKQMRHTSYQPCEQQKAWDERVQALFCFHKDKSVHHVRRGKEIDPWDRPDIDIRKYQRKEK